MFSDLLNEAKGFKYQVTLKVMLKKYTPNGDIELRPVYFNSTTKTVINHKFSFGKLFQELFYRFDSWINEGSGWIVELSESQYINVSTYRPLLGSSCIKLPVESRSPKKGLINIKKNIKSGFFGVMLSILIQYKHIQKELQKMPKKLLKISIMMKLNFL